LRLNLVDHPDFRDFVAALDPKFRLASKKRLTGNLIPFIYQKCLNKVKQQVQEANTIVLESDAWTDQRNKAFLGITSTMINENWDEKTFLLSIKRFKGQHTGVRLFDAYKSVTNEFKINNKITHNIISINKAYI
jgi:hypothetical protein